MIDDIKKKELLDKCVEFHGHICGGLTIGYKAALYAIELLNIDYSSDEEIVCISENDACCIDAISVILGCTVGKSNLLFHITGKMAFSFYNRKTGESVRIMLADTGENVEREDRTEYFMGLTLDEMFNVSNTRIKLPEQAHIFNSIKCEKCGELTGENWIRIQNNKKVCIDCHKKYDRFAL